LFRIGEPLGALYILRSGSIKTWAVSEEGDDHIIRFHLPGDVLGLGAISTGSYDCNATTLGTCNVCIITFSQFQKLAERIPKLNGQLLKMMSQEILRDRQILFLLSNRSAPVRIASFLNMLSQNYAARGYSPNDFNLTMGRREIASFLGLAMETVSRTFSQLQEEGLINVQGRHIRVTDSQALMKLCGSHGAADKGADYSLVGETMGLSS
jgi:CRP/FNR family transcriptional regulator